MQAVFQVGDRSWTRENRCPKKLKTGAFLRYISKLYSLKVHAQYFTVLIYITTRIAGKLGIFTHFTSTNFHQLSKASSRSLYIYRPLAVFFRTWSKSWSYLILQPSKKICCISPCIVFKNHDLKCSFDEEINGCLKNQFWSYKFTSESSFKQKPHLNKKVENSKLK